MSTPTLVLYKLKKIGIHFPVGRPVFQAFCPANRPRTCLFLLLGSKSGTYRGTCFKGGYLNAGFENFYKYVYGTMFYVGLNLSIVMLLARNAYGTHLGQYYLWHRFYRHFPNQSQCDGQTGSMIVIMIARCTEATAIREL